MRLSFVTDTYPPDVNGVANTLRRLGVMLAEAGHTVDFVLPGDLRAKALEAGVIEADSSAAALKLPALPVPGYKGLRFGLPSRSPLRRHWEKFRPDIVYVATESPLGYSAVEAADDLGIPVVSGFHTNFDTYMRDYQVPMLKEVASGYLKHLHNRTIATFAPSPDVVERLHGLGFGEVRLLGRGVDTEMFSPAHRDDSLRAAWGCGPGDTVALYVGRLAPEKNLPLALRAAALLRNAESDRGRNFKMVFVGDGPRRAELEKENPDCVFAGTRTGGELARHFASADLFVFPSTSETFGNVILEAMASGLATVAFDYAAARLHVRDGENGFTAPPGDEPAFLDACLRAARESGRDTIRRAARATTLAVSWTEVARRFEADLLELCGKTRGNS